MKRDRDKMGRDREMGNDREDDTHSEEKISIQYCRERSGKSMVYVDRIVVDT